MKKIILLTILTLSLTLQFGNNGVCISTTQQVFAQQSNCTWKCNQGGFFQWLKTAASNVATAVSNVASEIAKFFTGENNNNEEDNGGEEFGDETDSENWYEPSGSPDDFQMPFDDSWFQPPTWGEDEWDIYNSLDYWYGVYVNGGTTPTQDCNGVWGGTAYVGSCGVCISGSTGINACFVDSPRVDTVKPIKIPCSPEATARGNRLTNIRDSINGLWDVQDIKSKSLTSSFESGLSITKNGNTFNTLNYLSGSSNHVDVLTNSSGNNIVCGIHTHTKGFSIAPSPGDIYHLIQGQTGNSNYLADFVFSHDNSEWAIMIDTPSKAANFINLIPRDSGLQPPPNGGDWSKTFLLSNDKSMYSQAKALANYLYHVQHYPLEDVSGFADVIFSQLNLDNGIKYYKKENGQFKELGVQLTYDSSGRPIFKITTCQ